ncbi:2,3-bisphosphoglycerate-independent phosphoglycerate mutase, partial [Gemmiger sp.]|uniref:2,3-bisphosphoglycerate-independent phosphoglycerate mutase n=1 Tax=Gemmiger sp. TaxID=2049027 RepID=UPI003AF01670
MSKKPVMLCIMDGFGWTPDKTFGNAVAAANKPNLDKLFANYPMTTIEASGMAVGLPDGQMGNSEVGHTNMGAGRIVYQQLTLITKSIKDGEMLKNPVLVKNMKAAIDAGKAIHLMGLVGTGGVHSHADHWYGVLEMAKHMGAKDVYLHCIMDGRDTDPHSGKGFLADLQAKLDELGIGKIASVSGRYYAMDRDNNWDREEKAYAAFVYGEGNHAANAQEAIEASYAADVTDEFVIPVVTCEGGRVEDGDTVIFMNFRPDRAREMTWALTGNLPADAAMSCEKLTLSYVCTAQYDAALTLPIAFPPEHLAGTIGEYVSSLGIKQFRIAETEKYAHVTFFLNGGVEKQYEGEERVLVPSPKEYPTYDLIPQMSAEEVKDKLVARMDQGGCGLYVCNFANCDMVGHTGVTEAAIKAVETVDKCLGEVVECAKRNGIRLAVTADHGNADRMVEPDGSPNT